MHLRKLPSGRWNVIVQHAGQKASGTARTRQEALTLGARLLLDLGGTPRVAASGTTVAELLAAHLEAGTDWAPSYRADVEYVVARLPDQFLKRSLADVTPLVVDHLYRQLVAAGWSPHRIHRAHTVIGAAFRRARRWGWIEQIPTRDATLPRIPGRDDTTPNAPAVLAILRAAQQTDPAAHLAVHLAATTGLRRGEIVGLQWADIDHHAATLTVNRAITYTPASGLVARDPKTARSKRTIALSPATLALVDEHRRTARPLGPWLFSSDGLTPWPPNRLTVTFANVAATAGHHEVRLHDLRHWVATDLIGAGVDVRTVSDILGHARTSITVDRYAASVPGRQRAAVENLARRLSGR